MKNKNIEYMYKKAKERTKTRESDGSGYKIYHCYYDERGNRLKDKGYWDDVGVFRDSIFTCILWTHPRYIFEEEIRNTVFLNSKQNKKFNDWFDNAVKKYKKVGKSRKKVVCYEYPNISELLEPPKKSHAELFSDELNSTHHVQKCHIRSYITKNARYVDVCYPVEVIDETSLKSMADEVMTYIHDYSKFYEKYGDYEYGVAEYKEENPS